MKLAFVVTRRIPVTTTTLSFRPVKSSSLIKNSVISSATRDVGLCSLRSAQNVREGGRIYYGVKRDMVI